MRLASRDDAKWRVVWLHGWGLTHESMIPIATLFASQTENYAVDLAGFGGQTPPPSFVYGSRDYADDVAKFIKNLPPKQTIVIGHSNGGRVALQLAANYPEIVDSIVLLGGAGLPKKYSLLFRIYKFLLKRLSVIAKKIPILRNVRASSKDYKNAKGIMVKVFEKILDENLGEMSKNIKIPTLLIYGKDDCNTPVYIGEEYNKNIVNSVLCVIASDHNGLITVKIRQVHHLITKFIREKL
ncbi:MAG: alpha/beta hydrolase [Rickettsiales bacterium]|nr:alpha/beta hydrolase [Rickettsiales bacterium]